MPLYKELLGRDSTAASVLELRAERAGHVARCDARIIGEVIRDFGGGRLSKDMVIRPEVGVDQLAKPGDYMAAGAVLVRLHAPDARAAETMKTRLATAFLLTDEAIVPTSLIVESIKA